MSPRKLIIIRGPSGAGKSTVAKLVHARVSNKTALIEQDYYRHTMFNNLHTDLEAPRQVMFAGVRAALDHGYDVIIEGFMGMGKYRPYFDKLLAHHPVENYFYYLDVGFAETLRRHSSRSKELSIEKMKELYARTGPSGYDGERVIPENTSAAQACQIIVETSGVPLIGDEAGIMREVPRTTKSGQPKD